MEFLVKMIIDHLHSIFYSLIQLRLKNHQKIKAVKIILLLSLQFLSSTDATICNSFPKIFGGSLDNTYLYQIDVFNDYLAFAGDIYDSGLKGSSSSSPYLALSSISTSAKYYWVKVLSGKTGPLSGVKFSTDGALIIAHSWTLGNSYIVVFRVATGIVLSARRYSIADQKIYSNFYQSMVVSSGSAPCAYVLSNYKTSSTSCEGQNLFKFNPLIFSTPPVVWIKKTLTSVNNCGNLGLIFGQSEILLYAFSFYNGLSTVSLIDINGNSKWQYATPNGDRDHNNLINYKKLDLSTDMIIATSGYGYINYNRIISSSSSPYSVQTTDSKTFRDPTNSIDLEIRALYIVDRYNAKSLRYNTYYRWTELVAISFYFQTITYKRALPLMWSNYMTLGLFVSDSIYYVGSHQQYFHIDQMGAYQINPNFYHVLIYTSNMTQTTCYSMATTTALTAITMTTLAITPLASPIYGTSTVTFYNDTGAFTTIDINESKLTRVSWCVQNQFTVVPVTQAQQNFIVYSGTGDQNLPITPFKVTTNCGSIAGQYTYSCVDQNTGVPLSYANNLIEINSATGVIKISLTKPQGIYQIKVIGVLNDLTTQTSAKFTINVVPSDPPSFVVTDLSDIEVPLMKSSTYLFPAFATAVSGRIPSIGDIKDSVTGSLPTFVTRSTSTTNVTLAIAPTSMTDVGVRTLLVTLTDSASNTMQYHFSIFVTNQAPKVTTAIPTAPLIYKLNQDAIYVLPTSIDPEGLSYTVTLENGPSYVTLISQTQIRINPVDCNKDFGRKSVTIKLEDQEPKSFTYTLILEIKNEPPFFQGSIEQNQAVMIFVVTNYILPVYVDPEGCNVQVSLDPPFSLFLSIKDRQMTYAPSQLFQERQYDTFVVLTDNQRLNSSYPLHFTVYSPPSFSGNIPKTIEMMASNPQVFALPISPNIGQLYIVHASPLPRFATFNFPEYTFLPDRASDLGIFIISGVLKLKLFDISKSFMFAVNVTNDAPYLASGKIPNMEISQNSIETYKVPQAIDREMQDIYYKVHEQMKVSLPSFVTFKSQTLELVLAPTQLDKVGDYSMQLDIEDTFKAITSYKFSISVVYSSYESSDSPINLSPSISSQSSIQKGTKIKFNPFISSSKSDIKVYQVRLLLTKITKDQMATLKFVTVDNQQIWVQDIIKQISNQSIEISVSQNGISYPISYQIKSKDFSEASIQVQLIYPNPKNLSTSSIPDNLRALNLKRIQSSQKTYLFVLLENSKAEGEIPSQFTEESEKQIAQMLQENRITISNDTNVNVISGVAIQIILMQLEDISSLTTNSLISVSIPGYPQTIMSVLIKFIYFDILYTENWLPNVMNQIGIDFDQCEDDAAFSMYFSQSGFSSKLFLKNASSTLVYVILYIFGWLSLFVIQRLSSIWPIFMPLRDQLQGILIWKYSLTLLLSQFMPLVLCCAINFYQLRFDNADRVTMVSSLLSIIVIVVLAVALVAIYMRLRKLSKTFNQDQFQEFNEKFEPLTDGLKDAYTNPLIVYWKLITLIRWAFTLTIALTLNYLPGLQIQLLLVMSVISQALIMKCQPYDSTLINLLSFLNELGTSIHLYLMLSMTDYLDSQFTSADMFERNRLSIAWTITVLLITVILINLAVAIYLRGAQLVRYCVRRRRRAEGKQVAIAALLEEETRVAENHHQHSMETNRSQRMKQKPFIAYPYGGRYSKKTVRVMLDVDQSVVEDYHAGIHEMFAQPPPINA